jgi:hypothetical protein
VVFESLKVVPKQRVTSAWANSLVDAIEQVYWLGKRGDPDTPFLTIYGYYGFFDQALYVQGRPVIKDGDPVSIYDLFDYARDKITKAVDVSLLTSYTRDVRDRLVAIRIDAYGNVGIRIAEPVDEYGRVSVSAPGELLDELRPVYSSGSVTAPYNTEGLTVTLYKGGRPYVNVYYSLGGAGNVYVEVSLDGTNWRQLDVVALSTAGSGVRVYQGVAYPYVRARTDATGVDATLEVVASR